MKTFNTLRIVPTQDGYIVIKEQVAELWIEPDDVVFHLNKFDLPYKLRDMMDNEPIPVDLEDL